jgi:hypothetical protein
MFDAILRAAYFDPSAIAGSRGVGKKLRESGGLAGAVANLDEHFDLLHDSDPVADREWDDLHGDLFTLKILDLQPTTIPTGGIQNFVTGNSMSCTYCLLLGVFCAGSAGYVFVALMHRAAD